MDPARLFEGDCFDGVYAPDATPDPGWLAICAGVLGFFPCQTRRLKPSMRDSVRIPSPNLKEKAYLKMSELVAYLSLKTSFQSL